MANLVTSFGRTLFALCVVAFPSFASVAFGAPASSVQIGFVAQRFPWNGIVDVTCKVKDAPKDTPLVLFANGAEVVRVAATNGEQKVSFDANKIDALKGKRLNDVRITAKVEAK